MSSPELPAIFGRFESLVLWLFQRTADFPRRLRPSLTSRIENACLDVHEALVDARFARDRGAALDRANVGLDRLRLLLRLSRELQCLAPRQAEYAFAAIDEVGRMVGGWKRAGS